MRASSRWCCPECGYVGKPMELDQVETEDTGRGTPITRRVRERTRVRRPRARISEAEELEEINAVLGV